MPSWRRPPLPPRRDDLIAENRDYLVFVEVKLRKSAAFAEALNLSTGQKAGTHRRTAELYLCEHPEQTKQPRFDVIEVYAPFGTETKRPEIRHLEDAFS
ncbi:MAG: YraN family protein [Oscillospiraceae bacterium]